MIGYFPQNSDEGIRTITSNLVKEIGKSSELLRIDIKSIPFQYRKIRKFDPDIIHVLSGPSSVLVFIMSKVLADILEKPKLVISALHPRPLHFIRIISFFKPDLVLVQTKESEKKFSRLGCKIKYLLNGVDIQKFKPVDSDCKIRIRQKYDIENNRFLILHVGHIRLNRNISVLKSLQCDNSQVFIVGSSTTPIEEGVYNELIKAGCKITTTFCPNIEEIYAMSDCYVFPTTNEYNCIETPMSVLEAMASNLPIITTKFGSLPQFFSNVDGIFFYDTTEELLRYLDQVKNGSFAIRTREQVLKNSWAQISRELEQIYSDLIQ